MLKRLSDLPIFRIGFVTLFVLVLVPVLIQILSNQPELASPIYNIASEALVTVLVFIIVDRFYKLREERREEDRLLIDLLGKLQSNNESMALSATEYLRRLGWIQDGHLKRVVLINVNLSNANLIGANLERSELSGSNLEGAALYGANLNYANLRKCNFHRANLEAVSLQNCDLSKSLLSEANLSFSKMEKSNLSEVNLENALLQGADLHNALLSGANLTGANLQNANLQSVIMNETTILPDGTAWHISSDIMRFTNLTSMNSSESE